VHINRVAVASKIIIAVSFVVAVGGLVLGIYVPFGDPASFRWWAVIFPYWFWSAFLALLHYWPSYEDAIRKSGIVGLLNLLALLCNPLVSGRVFVFGPLGLGIYEFVQLIRLCKAADKKL
jgi:hypothetical protein